jgi:uncharacterized protein (DUF169 family)
VIYLILTIFVNFFFQLALCNVKRANGAQMLKSTGIQKKKHFTEYKIVQYQHCGIVHKARVNDNLFSEATKESCNTVLVE